MGLVRESGKLLWWAVTATGELVSQGCVLVRLSRLHHLLAGKWVASVGAHQAGSGQTTAQCHPWKPEMGVGWSGLGRRDGCGGVERGSRWSQARPGCSIQCQKPRWVMGYARVRATINMRKICGWSEPVWGADRMPWLGCDPH